MARIHLIRHGQASFGASDYDQLSERGYAQSRALGQYLKSTCDIDRVVIGTMKRHRQTAESMLEAWGSGDLAPTVSPAFDEFDHVAVIQRHRPEWADRSVMASDLRNREMPPGKAFQLEFRKALQRWTSGDFDSDYEEPWYDFRQRIMVGLESLQEQLTSGEDVAVVTSGGPISVILAQLLNLDLARLLSLNEQLVNASCSTLVASPGRVTVASINESAYLRTRGSDWITHR